VLNNYVILIYIFLACHAPIAYSLPEFRKIKMKQEKIDKRAIALRENLKKRKALATHNKEQDKERNKQDTQDAKS